MFMSTNFINLFRMNEQNAHYEQFLTVKVCSNLCQGKEETLSNCESMTFDTDVGDKCVEDKILEWLQSKGIEMREPEDIVQDF